MQLLVASPSRLQREAIRRSLTHSAFTVEAYAADLDSLRAAIFGSAPRLALLSARCGQLAQAVAELPKRGIQVAVLAEGSELDLIYQVVVDSKATVLAPPIIDDSGELHGAQRFVAQLDRLHRGLVPMLRSKPEPTTANAPRPTVIAIGASTGGPAAIRELLNALPRPLSAAVLVVQHIDAEYTQGFSDWLESVCGLPSHLADGDESPQAGHVYVAPAGHHLVMLDHGRLALQRGSAMDASSRRGSAVPQPGDAVEAGHRRAADRDG
ncbi:MAG: hypothetical protein IPK97_19275 [Ahniella sp.]|nr:hypothetical protein [Ahniella sp.]